MTRGNVLIVDDDHALLEALRDTLNLRLPKTEVHAIDSPKRALELLKTQRFRAIISDMRMPGMTGLELLRQVQEVQPQASFMLITGRGDLKLADEAFRNGAFDFIQKPFERCEFVDLLKTAFSAAA
jgi:two-component system C4-dicarboxylate transport response regulator DctD